MDAKALIVFLAVGALAGLLASIVVGGGGLLYYILIGVIGSFVGGFLFNALKINLSTGSGIVSWPRALPACPRNRIAHRTDARPRPGSRCFPDRVAGNAQTRQAPCLRRKMRLIKSVARQEIILFKATRHRILKRQHKHHSSNLHIVRHIHRPPALVKADPPVHHETVVRGNRLASHRQPQQVQLS